jgi:hypothetical protein
MSVYIQAHSEPGRQIVEVSLDGGGSVRIEKYKDGNVKVIATSNYDPDNPKTIDMNTIPEVKEYKQLSDSCTYQDFKRAKEKFTELYFDPAVVTMIAERPVNDAFNYKNVAISVGFKTQELLDSSDYIPDEFDGFQVVKRVVGNIKAQ